MNEKYYGKKELLLDLQIAREKVALIYAGCEIAMDDSTLTPVQRAAIKRSAQIKQARILSESMHLTEGKE